MNRSALGAIALVCLFLPFAVTPAGSTHLPAVQQGAAEWWGPTGATTGHHIRIPVMVENSLPVQVDQMAVKAEIDLAKVLSQAGWIHTRTGSQTILKGFQLDEDSIRVVQVTGFGSGDQILTQSSARQGDDRFVIPSVVVNGEVSKTGDIFDPTSTPVISVFWWAATSLGAQGSPTARQYYHVYLDSLTNGDHPASTLTGSDVGAADSIHWTGPAAAYYGVLPATRFGQNSPTIKLVGLFDGTTVQVDYRAGSNYQPHPLNPTVSLNEGETAFVGFSGSDRTEFRLRSIQPGQNDKDGAPFLAYAELLQGSDSTPIGTFVPALSGGYTGQSFVVDLTQMPANLVHSINFITPGTNGAVIQAALDDQTIYTVAIGDQSTQSPPYTVGAWDNGPSGTCQPRGGTFLAGGQVYDITSTNDILVQLGGQSRIQQIPALTGGPTGTAFATSLLDQWFGGASCQRSEDRRGWLIMSNQETTAEAWRMEPSPGRFEPPQGSQDPSHAVPEAPEFAGRFTANGDMINRPIFIHSDTPTTALSGSLRVPQIQASGAYGGANGGREFSGVGPFAVLGLYPDTRVEFSKNYHISGMEVDEFYISEDQSKYGENKQGTDTLKGFTLKASKPILVYGLAERATFLSGRPAFLDTTIGPADFRGNLLGINPISGVEPSTASTTPGKPVSFTFLVSNLGRGADGQPVADTANLQPGNVPTGWTATLDREVVPLAAGGDATIIMTVTPPDNAEARSSAVIPVIATSESNSRISVSSATVTYIQRSFDVGIWFDKEGGPTRKDHAGAADSSITYTISVKNEGTVTDTINLEASSPAPGWSVDLLKDGFTVQDFTLDGGESTSFTMVVQPPSNLKDGLMVTTVTAASGSQPAAFDTITAITRVRADAVIEVSYDDATRLVQPGESVDFDIKVTNAGEGSIELDLEASADLPPDWAEPAFVLVNPSNGKRIDVSRLSIGPGESLSFVVNTTAPKNSVAGELATVRALARPPGGASVFEVAFTAVSGAKHNVNIAPISLIEGRTDGSATPVELEVTNKGNLDERLRLKVIQLPANWTIQPAEPDTRVARGATETIVANLRGPIGAPAGGFDMRVALMADDGNLTIASARVDVPKATAIIVASGEPEHAQPGQAATAPFTITNAGNRAGRIEWKGGAELWSIQGNETAHLQPGQTVTLQAGWLIPNSASSTSSKHSIEVHLVPDDGTESVHEVISKDIDVGRPQLRISASELLSAPGGSLVRATLENAGVRTAHSIRLELRSGDEVIDEVTIEALQGGHSASFSLLDPERRANLRVVVDPYNSVAESEENDNQISLAGQAKEAPGVPFVAVLIAVSLALIVRVRNRSHR